MDTGNGNFIPVESERAKELEAALQLAVNEGSLKGSGIFRIGEEVEIKGSRFIVNNISTHKLSLTLQKRQARN